MNCFLFLKNLEKHFCNSTYKKNFVQHIENLLQYLLEKFMGDNLSITDIALRNCDLSIIGIVQGFFDIIDYRYRFSTERFIVPITAYSLSCLSLHIYIEIAKFMYLYHHNKPPELFSPFFNITKNIHPHVIRSTTRKNYFVPHVNSNSAKKSLLFMGNKIWNGLRFEWKEFSSTNLKKL